MANELGPQDSVGAEQVRAAGGVLVRDGLVLLVHRPKYDDWSLPKGKLDPDESWEDAAVREVYEETGWRTHLGRFLTETHYNDRKGRPKTVRWWEMEPLEHTGFEPNDEIDDLRWVPLSEAPDALQYDTDRAVLEALAREP
ncbi:MAG TPA: NUDIX hydrolase [Thermoleophilaceae bacterium]